MNFILFTLVELETIVNPYYAIGELHNQGLDYVIDNLPASPTKKDLIDVVSDFALSISSDSSVLEAVPVKVFLSNLVNKGDCCNDWKDVKTDQRKFLSMAVNPAKNVAVADLAAYYVLLENDIHTSELSAQDKGLPMLAAAVGRHSALYWNAQVTAGVASPWNTPIAAAGSSVGIPKFLKKDIQGAIDGAIDAAEEALHDKKGNFWRRVLKGAIVGAITKSAEAALFPGTV